MTTADDFVRRVSEPEILSPRPARPRPVKPRPMSEAAWQSRVMDYSRLMGWRRVHIRNIRTERKGWTVPYEGDTGLLDLILARGGRVILVELKTEAGQPTADQLLWLHEAGPNGYLWRPSDWPEVQAVLAR